MRRPVVSLVSDFGLRDAYVAEMKAVVLGICPDVELVDISHEVAKFDVRMGAFVLASAAPYFQKGTVHVAVVDPGVGTKRRPLVVETRHSLFVGPDNGLLMLAAEREGVKHVYAISNSAFVLPQFSKTFHGRDVFAPVAAYLAKGHVPSEVGTEITDYVIPEFAKPSVKASTVIGEVLHIDSFGNVVTNISPKELDLMKVKKGDLLQMKIDGKLFTAKYCSAYGEVGVNELLAVIGGHCFLEVAVNQGSASEKLKANSGIQISIRRRE